MAAYRKLALLGRGFLGTVVVEQLAKAGFSVTVLTLSQASVKDIPSGVSVVEVNYDSPNSVTNALKGQDILVNTAGADAIAGQKPIIYAAISAGVKRYVPANYGPPTADPEAQKLAVLMPMVDIQNYLKNKAAEGKTEWTVFQTGAFLDTIVGLVALAFDPTAKSIQWYDAGEANFSATTLTTFWEGDCSCFDEARGKKNRVVFVHDIAVTQKKLVELAKKYLTAGPEWTEIRVSSVEKMQRTSDFLKARGSHMTAAMGQRRWDS